MATIICVDGLGAYPRSTFAPLLSLEHDGHTVVILDSTKVEIHEERVQLVMNACDDAELPIFLVGQSAGGSAVRVAAERLSRLCFPLAGVILLSPAMPLGYSFLTWHCLRVIGMRLLDMFTKTSMVADEEECLALAAPIAAECHQSLLVSRLPIATKEARRLAFCPPLLRGYRYPTLYVNGALDRWISAKAHKKLAARLGADHIEVPEAGHVTLASSAADDVVRKIRDWVHFRRGS